MMPAVKMLDPITGIDIHMVAIPAVPTPIPMPIPHPYVGMVFDVMAFLPLVGATVWVQGMPKGTAGTSGKAIVPHIPMGGPFLPLPPSNSSELFMGSATVLMEGDPATFTALPVLSCNSFGMPPPPRAGKTPAPALELPTSMVMAIPTGLPVLIGGPPTVNMMGLLQKAGMALGGKLLSKLKNTKFWRRISQKIHNAAGRTMTKLGIPEGSKWRDRVHKSICSLTGHPVDIASGKVITDHMDFSLPGPIPLEWERFYSSASRYEGPLGYGWHHSYDLALAEDEQVVAVRLEDGRPFLAPRLAVGESHFDRLEKRTLFRDARGYGLRDKDSRLTHRFLPAGRDGICRLGSLEDDLGHAIVFHYDAQERLSGILDSAGRQIEVIHDGLHIRSIRLPHPTAPDASGERPVVDVVEYHVDAAGDLVEVRDALKRPWRFRYEGHLLVSETLRDGLTFRFAWRGKGARARCLRTWGDGGLYDHSLRYDSPRGLTVVTDSLGARTRHFHEGGVVRRVVDALGHESQTLLNEWNEPFGAIDELGRSSLIQYDERGNAVTLIPVDGAILKIEYRDDLPVKAVDALGGEWLWSYDPTGRLLERTDPLQRTTRYEHDERRLVAVTDPLQGRTELRYDRHSNLSGVTYPDGSQHAWVHDRWGRVGRMIDERGGQRDFAIDLLGNVAKIREPDGNLRLLEYDAEENLIRARDQHRDVQMGYRGMGRLAWREENGTRVEFAYDTEEQLTAIRNEERSVYAFQHDPLGRVVRETGWDGLLRSYRHDPVGNVVQVDRPGERWTRYEHDASDQVVEAIHWDGTQESFRYRIDGALESAQNAHVELTWERDLLGRVLREKQGEHWVESRYDDLDRRIGFTSSLGAHQTIARSVMGEVESVRMGQPEEAPVWEASFRRDVSGLEIERSLPGGVRSRWERDAYGRPVRHTITGRTALRTRDYAWDVDDRLKKIVDSAHGPVEFKHDAFGNLQGALYADFQSLLRMPDAVGNLFRTSDRKDRKYGPSGQLLEATDATGTTRYEYDAEGNLVLKTMPDATQWRYRWNAAGHLEEVLRPDGLTVRFEYDPLGRRIAKSFAGRTTRWVWDGNLPLHEWTEDHGQILSNSDMGTHALPDARLHGILQDLHAQTISPVVSQGPPPTLESPLTWLFEPDTFAPMARLQGDARQSIVCDHLGTPLEMYDAQGERIWAAELDIYGNVRTHSGNRSLCPFRYPGQYEDLETGLHYNRFRYYDPQAGGYISQDPIGLAGGNPTLYGYVGDPNEYVDPFGLSKRTDYLGKTPGKSSRTGREVTERMRSEGTVRGKGSKTEFFDKTKNKWYPISKADMGHKHDAVQYWNKTGRKHGPKSKTVRKWMLDPDNYELQHYNSNRSSGAKLQDRYRDPPKKKKPCTGT